MNFLEYYLKEESLQQIKILKILGPDEALDIIQKARVGGKRKGEAVGSFRDEVTEPMAIIDLPIADIGDEEIETLKSASNPDRVRDYSKQIIDAPIYAIRKKRSNGWYVSDGGHRVTAAILRGDTTIKTIVPVSSLPSDIKEQSADPSEHNKILMGFNSISEIVKSEAWDKLAFGFESGAILNIPTKDLKVKYRQDYDNAKDEIESGAYKYKDAWDDLPPIEVALEKGKLYIEDGYHRYYYAKKNKIPSIRSEVTIKMNPITTLGFKSIDDLIHQWERLKGK